MAAYQGKCTRPVPDAVVEDVRQQIEASAHHLIDHKAQADDPVRRYAAVTRVHMLCILRGTGGGRYSRWYRDSHYLHHVITRQTPPDLSDCENILVLIPVTQLGHGMGSTQKRKLCDYSVWYENSHCDYRSRRRRCRGGPSCAAAASRRSRIRSSHVASFPRFRILSESRLNTTSTSGKSASSRCRSV
jgi:hypothetical protein